MIWWKGNGLWLGTLIALAVLAGGKTMGPMGVPAELLVAAVALLCMKSCLRGFIALLRPLQGLASHPGRAGGVDVWVGSVARSACHVMRIEPPASA